MKGYKKYYTNKIIWYLITFIVAIILNFVLPRLMPGDPVASIVARATEGMTDSTAIQQVYEEYTEKFGIDKPMTTQFFTFIKNAIKGDFGV